MPPPKYDDMQIAGMQVQLNATDRKLLTEGIIKALKEQKSLLGAIAVLSKQESKLQKEQVYGGKEITKNYLARLAALKKIKDMMVDAQVHNIPSNAHGHAGAWSGMMAGAASSEEELERKKIADLKEEGAAQDELRKKTSWQLVYWGLAGSAWKEMTDNSKVLAHYTDVIGSAFGFILDMILLQLMPIVIPFVNFLFSVGEWFTTLPTYIKDAIAAVTLLGIALVTLAGWVGADAVIDAVAGIGAAAVTASGSAGVGALSAAFLPFLVGGAIGLGLGAIAVKLLDMTGALQAVSDAGKGFRASDFGK